jgi:hypothetical protein
MSTIGTDEHLNRDLLGTSRLKDGVDVAVPRRSPEGAHVNPEDPREEDGRLGCSG